MVRSVILFLMLLVSPVWAQQPADTRLMILHDHGHPVVAEMVKLTLRGEYDLTVTLENLTFPDSADYDWIQIAQDRWFKERIGGRMIQIFERDIAIFPRHAGEIDIGPLVHELTYIPRSGGRHEVQVTSAPARLNVGAFPHAGRPLTAQALVLTDELSAEPGQLGPDEVLTRRVTIEALGTLAHHLPKRPDLRQPWLISFTQPELRETTPTPDGPVARVVWEWQLRPHTGEPGVLPAIAFPWFDTDTRQIEVAAMRPLPFGLAGFGSNLRAGTNDTRGRDLTAAAAAIAGFAAALAVFLWGRLPAVSAGFRKLRPSPYMVAMRAAAGQGDLLALRAASTQHVRWRSSNSPGQAKLLAHLDRQIFGASQGEEFVASGWLAEFLRQ